MGGRGKLCLPLMSPLFHSIGCEDRGQPKIPEVGEQYLHFLLLQRGNYILSTPQQATDRFGHSYKPVQKEYRCKCKYKSSLIDQPLSSIASVNGFELVQKVTTCRTPSRNHRRNSHFYCTFWMSDPSLHSLMINFPCA